MHFDYVCDACGFTSEEERGVYKCPKCGNQMRAAQHGVYSGDSSSTVGRWLLTIICCFVSLFVFVLILGPLFGIIAALIVTFLVWRFTKKASQGNAIKTSAIKNPNQVYSCNSCRGTFKGQLPKCPHCGITLKYD